MHKALKEVEMDLLFENHFPVSGRVVSEDPEYYDICEKIEITTKKMKENFTDDEYKQVSSLVALMELKDGYQYMEYFHSGLLTGFFASDLIEDTQMKNIIFDLIR